MNRALSQEKAMKLAHKKRKNEKVWKKLGIN